MKNRDIWKSQIQALWRERSIIWLSGVRRVGKTSLCKQIADARFYNCDLPSVRRMLNDPEYFLAQQVGQNTPIVLDEVHRIDDPSLLLKIAADEYGSVKIVATGSSTLQATKKFRDSLTDRKRTLRLAPVLWRECCDSFGVRDLDQRLLCGGFPELLLSGAPDPTFFEDWMDGFYARDIQELFGVRNRTGFLRLLSMICLRNGGQLDISNLAKESGLSRPTVMSHLDAMEIAHAILRVPPYFGGGQREIVKQPKIYAFDTGLVAHVKGWESIRESDRGVLWENLVLDEILYRFPSRLIHYWRNRKKEEIDFVLERKSGHVDAIEVKINPDAFNIKSLMEFRSFYPKGNNYVVCPFVDNTYTLRKSDHVIHVCRPDQIGNIP